MGYLSGSRFNLVVSLRYAPLGGEADFWCELFNHVSRIVSDSTDGALSIGQVLIAPDSTSSRDADIWVHPRDEVAPNSKGARLWFPSEAMDISQDYVMVPTLLVHELGHYLYGLGDEYENDTKCIGRISRQASLMEKYGWGNMTRWTDDFGDLFFSWASFFPAFTSRTAVLRNGQPSEFCYAINHNKTANNSQNKGNGKKSCWTYMASDANHNAIPYGLVEPGASGPLRPKPPPPPPVTCSTLFPVQRSMLILGVPHEDGHGADAAFEAARSGARFWIDYVTRSEEFGLAIDADPATIASGISAVPAGPSEQEAWRSARHELLNRLTASGTAALGDVLRASLTELTAGGRAASQVICVLTDGNQRGGTETVEEVLPDLRAAGVRVYPIGLGDEQNGVLLANLAIATGGTYFAITGALAEVKAATAVMDALIQVAAESRENGGIVSFEPIGPGVPDAEAREVAPPFDWPGSDQRDGGAERRSQSFQFEVSITPGSSLATLGVAWSDPEGLFDVTVRDPAGDVIEAGRGVRKVSSPDRHAFYEIEAPRPGDWIVDVSGGAPPGTRFRTIGFESNHRISLDVSIVQTHVRLGDEIELRARLRAPMAVPGARIVAHVLPPEGRWDRVPFTEHTGSLDDPLEPLTYTATYPTSDGRPGPYLIVVDARRDAGTFEVALDELYRDRPGLTADQFVRSFDLPEIRRRTVLTAVADLEGRTEREPIAGYNTVDAWLGAPEQLVGVRGR